MSGCISCGAPTPRRKCKQCSLADHAEELVDDVDDYPECPECGGETSGEGVECYKCRKSEDAEDQELRADGGEDPVYHIVCHRCDFEDLIEGDRVLAAATELLHKKRTSHRVEYEEVSR